MCNIFYKATKGNTEDKNLEVIYDLFKFNGSNAIEFKIEDGVNNKYKVLWLKNNPKNVGIYINNKLQSTLFQSLEETYFYLINNKGKLFNKNTIKIKSDNGKKTISSLSSIELDAVIDLMEVLNKKEITNKKVKLKKSNIDLNPTYCLKEKKKANEDVIKEKSILKNEKEFFIKIEFFNSSILKYPDNRANYQEALKVYSKCKADFPTEKVSLLKFENGIERVLYEKDNRENKKVNRQLGLMEQLSNLCNTIKESKDALICENAVLDKEVNIVLHEIESKTFSDNLMEYKSVVDNLKVLLEERRDVKKAIIINNKIHNKINSLGDYNKEFDNVVKMIKGYEKGANDYVEKNVDVKIYKYKDADEYNSIISHFSGDTVRSNPEKKEIYVYKKHAQ